MYWLNSGCALPLSCEACWRRCSRATWSRWYAARIAAPGSNMPVAGSVSWLDVAWVMPSADPWVPRIGADDNGDGAVVDQSHHHLGAEGAGLHRQPALP